MTNLGRHNKNGGSEIDLISKKKGWKKVFGGGKSTKKPGVSDGLGLRLGKKSKRGRFNINENSMVNGGATVNGVGEGGGAGGVQTEDGFVGMGTDGVWISRKNFVKT